MVLRVYILKQLFIWLFIVTLIMTACVWLTQMLRLVELLVNKGAFFIDFMYISLFYTPHLIFSLLPVSAAIATCIVMWKLYQDREVIAMYAAGITPIKIAASPIVFGLVVSAFLLVNSFYIIPFTYTQHQTILNNLRTSAPIVILQEGVFTDLTDGLTIYAETREGNNILKDIFIQDARDENRSLQIHARKAVFAANSGLPKMDLFDGIIIQTSAQNRNATVIEFDSYTLAIRHDATAGGNRNKRYSEMSVRTLLTATDPRDYFVRGMRAEGHFRLAVPWSGLSLVLLTAAVILKTRYKRIRGRSPYIIITLVILIVQVALTISKGLLISNPSAFPVVYVISIGPGLIALVMLSKYRQTGKAA